MVNFCFKILTVRRKTFCVTEVLRRFRNLAVSWERSSLRLRPNAYGFSPSTTARAATLPTPTYFPFSRHRCSHSSHSNIGNDGYAITFANDKRFGLVESSSRRRRAECFPHLVWHIFVAAVYGTFDGHKSWYFEYYSLKLP